MKDEQPIKRRPGRPRLVLTPDQEQKLALAELHYWEYRRVQRLAREEARRRVAAHRDLAVQAVQQALDSGLSISRVSREVAKTGRAEAIKNLIQGEGANG